MNMFLRGSLCLGLFAVLMGSAQAADTSTSSAVTAAIVEPDAADNARAVPLQGALNVRDLGGMAGEHGTTPYNHFLRAANLAHLTAADRETLYAHQMVLDIDLRTAQEESASPDALASDPHIRYLSISLLGDQPLTPDKLTSLRDMYVNALADDQPAFKQVFEAIAETGEGAVLYHCTVGKDRTGMVSAMLLELAGVPRDQIVHNYALSAYYLKPMMDAPAMKQMLAAQPAVARLMGSPPEAIEAFLDTLDKDYGGTATYLRTVGVSAANIAKLRDRLVH